MMASIGPAMRECSYELYRAIYVAIRQGIATGDAHIVERVSLQIAGRDSGTCLVMMLALIEAKSGAAERSKENVCTVLCDMRCQSPAVA